MATGVTLGVATGVAMGVATGVATGVVTSADPDENLRAPFIYMMQCPLAFLDPLDPPSPPKEPQKFQNGLKTALLR